MIGLGGQEILVLIIFVMIPLGIILIRRQSGSRIADLESENRRLRERLDEDRTRDDGFE